MSESTVRESTVRESTVIATRPTPGQPRPYDFPPFARATLANGLNVITAQMPGRPLVTASLILRNGCADDAADVAGATSLASRAISEGTERYDAVALVDEAHQAVGGQLFQRLASALAGEVEPAGDIARARRAPRLQKEEDLLAGRFHARSSSIRNNVVV